MKSQTELYAALDQADRILEYAELSKTIDRARRLTDTIGVMAYYAEELKTETFTETAIDVIGSYSDVLDDTLADITKITFNVSQSIRKGLEEPEAVKGTEDDLQ